MESFHPHEQQVKNINVPTLLNIAQEVQKGNKIKQKNTYWKDKIKLFLFTGNMIL